MVIDVAGPYLLVHDKCQVWKNPRGLDGALVWVWVLYDKHKKNIMRQTARGTIVLIIIQP